MFQSAPAIAGGRCQLRRLLGHPVWQFQSAPAIAGGRCVLQICNTLSLSLFQSAPAIAGGRCLVNREDSPCMPCFNPRPPLLAGDAGQAPAGARLQHGFNPRPPLLAGDACHTWRAGVSIHVSIRARHCWRAMLMHGASASRSRMFQSAPAIAGGRCLGLCGNLYQMFCFNPRPPLLAGDALIDQHCAGKTIVSIRARHCWRAMHISDRRNALQWSFNPRPPLLAGDALHIQSLVGIQFFRTFPRTWR